MSPQYLRGQFVRVDSPFACQTKGRELYPRGNQIDSKVGALERDFVLGIVDCDQRKEQFDEPIHGGD
jgi:hypothetical protein